MAADRITVLDNGDVLEVTADSATVVDRVHVGLSYVDQAGGGDITESVLRDRRHLADDGLVLVVARVDASTGQPLGEIEIVTRGFGSGKDEELIEETRAASRTASPPRPASGWSRSASCSTSSTTPSPA